MKLFAVRLRCIVVEVICLQGLQKKIMGIFSWFMHVQAKLFALIFICIREVFTLQGL